MLELLSPLRANHTLIRPTAARLPGASQRIVRIVVDGRRREIGRCAPRFPPDLEV
jgi:hypothetical protein